jgi:hypothetical protein
MIGLLGKKKHGKDTCADMLVSERGYTKQAFADPLKKGIQQFFRFSDEQLYNEVKKEEIDERWGFSPRKAMQIIGTDLLRQQFPLLMGIDPITGDQMWVKNMELRCDELAEKGSHNIVISDVRFQNEVDWILSRGGTIIKITRPDLCNVADTHSSESSIDIITNYTHSIINDGTIEELYAKLRLRLKPLMIN